MPDGYVLREMCKSDYRKAWKNGANERETAGNMKKGDCYCGVGKVRPSRTFVRTYRRAKCRDRGADIVAVVQVADVRCRKVSADS